MEGLEALIKKKKGHYLINAALLYIQFLHIHPFRDGNGRSADLLIALYLYEKGIEFAPSLYMKYYLRVHMNEFQRIKNHGTEDEAISFFLKGIPWTVDVISDISNQLGP
jgi:Fic family protein